MNMLISVENLNKTFGSHTALNQVSFDIKKGQTSALVGPNGAGKTTLFSILCGYLTPDTGKVSILGSPLGSESLFGLLSALPQDGHDERGEIVIESKTKDENKPNLYLLYYHEGTFANGHFQSIRPLE